MFANKNQPKTIGYVCLFNDIQPDESLDLQIKYLKEKKECNEVFFDAINPSDDKNWPDRPKFEEILKSMRANDSFWVLNTKHHELIKIHFKERENGELPLEQEIDTVEKLLKDLKMEGNQ